MFDGFAIEARDFTALELAHNRLKGFCTGRLIVGKPEPSSFSPTSSEAVANSVLNRPLR